MTKNVYAVMGASGQIGHIVVEYLLKQGHQVKAIGRDQKKLALLQSKGAEIIPVEGFDEEAVLTKAFKGVDAVFGMIPPGYGLDNVAAFQDRVGEAMKTAIQKNSIPYLVNLSSIGANLPEGTGPIKGLYRQEQRLNTLSNLNVLHFRPTYFMENLFWVIPVIQQTDTLQTPFLPELALPMVSTEDIGLKAAEFLDQLNFKGHTVFEFVGPRKEPLNLIEVTKILGNALGKPNLKYIQQSYEEAKMGMLAIGMNLSTTELMLEMYKGFNEGKCILTQKLTTEHQGKITMEQFATNFAKVYKEQEKQKMMA